MHNSPLSDKITQSVSFFGNQNRFMNLGYDLHRDLILFLNKNAHDYGVSEPFVKFVLCYKSCSSGTCKHFYIKVFTTQNSHYTTFGNIR